MFLSCSVRPSDWYASTCQLQWHHARRQAQGLHRLGVVWERSVDTRPLAAGWGAQDCAESGKCSLLFCGCKYAIISSPCLPNIQPQLSWIVPCQEFFFIINPVLFLSISVFLWNILVGEWGQSDRTRGWPSSLWSWHRLSRPKDSWNSMPHHHCREQHSWPPYLAPRDHPAHEWPQKVTNHNTSCT